MGNRRFLLDTNVTVSAAIMPRSVPRRAFDKALDHGRPLMSGPILLEITEVLGRARFDRYASREHRDRFLATLVEQALFPSIREAFQVCRDPKDDKFLDLAVAGAATCLITGDADLLVLDPFHGIPIVTPRKFLDEFHFDEDEPTDANGEATEDLP
jgi:putative PIN family toxin of toxin-antitoxin system